MVKKFKQSEVSNSWCDVLPYVTSNHPCQIIDIACYHKECTGWQIQIKHLCCQNYIPIKRLCIGGW